MKLCTRPVFDSQTSSTAIILFNAEPVCWRRVCVCLRWVVKLSKRFESELMTIRLLLSHAVIPSVLITTFLSQVCWILCIRQMILLKVLHSTNEIELKGKLSWNASSLSVIDIICLDDSCVLGLKSRFVPVIEFFSHCGRVWKGNFQPVKSWRVKEEMISAATAHLMITVHH